MAEARPDVMAARSGTAIARANMSLARAARIQDIQAGPIYETADDGTSYLGLRLQREFGVFNNGSALRDQRQTEVQQQILAHDQLRRRATNEASAAIDRYERARRYAAEAAHEDALTPRGELEQVVAQFEAGKADIINVLAIQNNLLQDLRAFLDLVNEVAQSAALVTQATGLPPERLLAPPRPEPLPPVEP
jgi:outer membrane protein TolC